MVLDESMKLEETMEFVYEETEETEGGSAHHGFVNPRGYVGMGQLGTGTGTAWGTHSKPIPVQWVWWVFLRHYNSKYRYSTVYASIFFLF